MTEVKVFAQTWEKSNIGLLSEEKIGVRENSAFSLGVPRRNWTTTRGRCLSGINRVGGWARGPPGTSDSENL